MYTLFNNLKVEPLPVFMLGLIPGKERSRQIYCIAQNYLRSGKTCKEYLVMGYDETSLNHRLVEIQERQSVITNREMQEINARKNAGRQTSTSKYTGRGDATVISTSKSPEPDILNRFLQSILVQQVESMVKIAGANERNANRAKIRAFEAEAMQG